MLTQVGAITMITVLYIALLLFVLCVLGVILGGFFVVAAFFPRTVTARRLAIEDGDHNDST